MDRFERALRDLSAWPDGKGPRPTTIGHDPEDTGGGETKKANLKEKQRPFATAFGQKKEKLQLPVKLTVSLAVSMTGLIPGLVMLKRPRHAN